MNSHTTFTGSIGERMERFCDRWMSLTNRTQPPKSIERSQQLCRRLDLACNIAEKLEARQTGAAQAT